MDILEHFTQDKVTYLLNHTYVPGLEINGHKLLSAHDEVSHDVMKCTEEALSAFNTTPGVWL